MSYTRLRRDFLRIIGESYEQYGYPEYCGWIEGLLLLEPVEWSQRGISKRLGEIFPASKYPTSVSSVNRALKLLETYGVIERAGSRKTGFRYRLVSSSNLVASMLYHLMNMNQEFIKKMESLSDKNIKADSDLERATTYQISMAQTWNLAISQLLESLQDELEE
ncbi:MAG: hypothetical protein JW779_13780 [Candidatus Thorarchaeota archaeon]|nr:hypothetical protein [Candidatus Thorarchaeota archaeon]